MNNDRRARDLALLDFLDKLDRVPLKATVWRIVREGRDPLLCSSSAGRWDPGRFDVLYTSCSAEGALAEVHFHLSRQPVFPSASFLLNEIHIETRRTLQLSGSADLRALGVNPDDSQGVLYQRSQEIGDAAAFLGFDAIVVPSARWQCLNLVAFCDSLEPGDIELASSAEVDWTGWRGKSKDI